MLPEWGFCEDLNPLAAECLYSLQWATTFPFKIAPELIDLDPTEYMVHWARINILNGFAIGLATFAGLTDVADRANDRPCYTICSNKLHPHDTAMRPNNNNNNRNVKKL